MTRTCPALAIVVLLGAGTLAVVKTPWVAHASQHASQSPVFRSGVGLVQVPAVVRDTSGAPVRGLPPDAFALFESGRRMPLVSVEEVRRDPSSPDYTPRDVIIVVDDLNTRPEVMPRAVDAAHELLDALDPRDRVAFLNTGTSPDLRTDLSDGRAAITRALGRVRGQQLPGGGFEWWRARQGLAVLRAVCEQLRSEASGARRISLVLFTEGYVFEPGDQQGFVDVDILRDVRAIVGLAAQANMAIYAIHAAGLEVTGRVSQSTSTRPIGPGATARRGTLPLASSLAAIDDLSALAALAHDTGGRLTRWTNNLLLNVPAMLSDADEYYLLTYEMPEFTDRDRKGEVPAARQIDVRVRRPDVTVRARQSYVHPRALS